MRAAPTSGGAPNASSADPTLAWTGRYPVRYGQLIVETGTYSKGSRRLDIVSCQEVLLWYVIDRLPPDDRRAYLVGGRDVEVGGSIRRMSMG